MRKKVTIMRNKVFYLRQKQATVA